MSPQPTPISATVEVRATPEDVWAVVSDLGRMPEFSPELRKAFVIGRPGVGANIVNNLPLGLLAGAAGHAAQAPDKVMAGLLIGVDLGPNLSVTGSPAWKFSSRKTASASGWTASPAG